MSSRRYGGQYEDQKVEAQLLRLLPQRIFDTIRYHEAVLVTPERDGRGDLRATNLVITEDAVFLVDANARAPPPPFLLVDVTRFEILAEGATWLVKDQALRSRRCYLEARRYAGTQIPWRLGVITWVPHSELVFQLERSIVAAKSRMLRGVVFSEAAGEVRAALQREFDARAAQDDGRGPRASDEFGSGKGGKGGARTKAVAFAPGTAGGGDARAPVPLRDPSWARNRDALALASSSSQATVASAAARRMVAAAKVPLVDKLRACLGLRPSRAALRRRAEQLRRIQRSEDNPHLVHAREMEERERLAQAERRRAQIEAERERRVESELGVVRVDTATAAAAAAGTSMSRATVEDAKYDATGTPRGAFWDATSPRDPGQDPHPLTPRALVNEQERGWGHRGAVGGGGGGVHANPPTAHLDHAPGQLSARSFGGETPRHLVFERSPANFVARHGAATTSTVLPEDHDAFGGVARSEQHVMNPVRILYKEIEDELLAARTLEQKSALIDELGTAAETSVLISRLAFESDRIMPFLMRELRHFKHPFPESQRTEFELKQRYTRIEELEYIRFILALLYRLLFASEPTRARLMWLNARSPNSIVEMVEWLLAPFPHDRDPDAVQDSDDDDDDADGDDDGDGGDGDGDGKGGRGRGRGRGGKNGRGKRNRIDLAKDVDGLVASARNTDTSHRKRAGSVMASTVIDRMTIESAKLALTGGLGSLPDEAQGNNDGPSGHLLAKAVAGRRQRSLTVGGAFSPPRPLRRGDSDGIAAYATGAESPAMAMRGGGMGDSDGRDLESDEMGSPAGSTAAHLGTPHPRRSGGPLSSGSRLRLPHFLRDDVDSDSDADRSADTGAAPRGSPPPPGSAQRGPRLRAGTVAMHAPPRTPLAGPNYATSQIVERRLAQLERIRDLQRAAFRRVAMVQEVAIAVLYELVMLCEHGHSINRSEAGFALEDIASLPDWRTGFMLMMVEQLVDLLRNRTRRERSLRIFRIVTILFLLAQRVEAFRDVIAESCDEEFRYYVANPILLNGLLLDADSNNDRYLNRSSRDKIDALLTIFPPLPKSKIIEQQSAGF